MLYIQRATEEKQLQCQYLWLLWSEHVTTGSLNAPHKHIIFRGICFALITLTPLLRRNMKYLLPIFVESGTVICFLTCSPASPHLYTQLDAFYVCVDSTACKIKYTCGQIWHPGIHEGSLWLPVGKMWKSCGSSNSMSCPHYAATSSTLWFFHHSIITELVVVHELIKCWAFPSMLLEHCPWSQGFGWSGKSSWNKWITTFFLKKIPSYTLKGFFGSLENPDQLTIKRSLEGLFFLEFK